MLSRSPGEQAHQFVLAAIGVLILVHHHEFVAPVQALARGVVVAQQAHGFEQQVVEIEGVRFAQARLVAFVNDGQARGGGIGGGAGQISSGDLLVALGVADARERRAVLHELVVQAELLVDDLEHRDLIVVVVDGEERREAAAELGQRRAFAPQQADAEGVKGGDGRARSPGRCPATSDRTRSRISPAALLVKVTARIAHPGTRWAVIRWAMRWVMTRVLPLPAPARTSRGPSACSTASRWRGFSPSRKSMNPRF